jgi:UDP-N-acetylglucosamine:LPS N-acetylglucosamine transferase
MRHDGGRQEILSDNRLQPFGRMETDTGILQTVEYHQKEKPDAIITTGAAPGLICVFAGWLLRRKTIWIDSIANVNRLSLSGRIAALFVSRVYTQWQHLATDKIHYAGDIFG